MAAHPTSTEQFQLDKLTANNSLLFLPGHLSPNSKKKRGRRAVRAGSEQHGHAGTALEQQHRLDSCETGA